MIVALIALYAGISLLRGGAFGVVMGYLFAGLCAIRWTSGATAPDKVVDELKAYDFEIISTNLPEEQEDQLREACRGRCFWPKGLLAIFWPGLTASGFVNVIAGWAVLTGALEVLTAILLRTEVENGWLLTGSGVLSVLLVSSSRFLPVPVYRTWRR